MKTTFLICILGLTVKVLTVHCQLSKTLGNRYKPQLKLPNHPENKFPSKKVRNNNEESKLNQEMDYLSARINPSNLKKSNKILVVGINHSLNLQIHHKINFQVKNFAIILFLIMKNPN